MQKLNNQTRILGRSLALELTPEDVLQVFGGLSAGDDGNCKMLTTTHVHGQGPDDDKCDDN